ncbi:MAG: hypothetical protein M3126_01000 [Candidatus Eremiobacteraeota bacterium]|nr:hypothetical protein [Candidatus Eremiobacteraeota bacterium]
MKTRTLLGVLFAGAIFAVAATSVNADQYGSFKATWSALPIINLNLTPNYTAGYGPQGGAGSGSTPAPGPSAAPSAGFIDFGNVVQGYQYLYKYAVQVNVASNDPLGFKVYASGTTDLNGVSGGTWPINGTLFWLNSNAGNSAFSPATSFAASPANSVVWSYPTTAASPGVNSGFDYELRLTTPITIDRFNVTIQYTAVGN